MNRVQFAYNYRHTLVRFHNFGFPSKYFSVFCQLKFKCEYRPYNDHPIHSTFIYNIPEVLILHIATIRMCYYDSSNFDNIYHLSFTQLVLARSKIVPKQICCNCKSITYLCVPKSAARVVKTNSNLSLRLN